jgi:hypothetical protein
MARSHTAPGAFLGIAENMKTLALDMMSPMKRPAIPPVCLSRGGVPLTAYPKDEGMP